jgi:phage recombination protein Bet
MTSLSKIEPIHSPSKHFDESQLNLIKTTICKGASDDELKFFISVCQRTGLDPFSKQIYSIARGGQRTIQVSIDGLRAIADRTGKYAPGKPTIYAHDPNGNLLSATAFVKKQTDDGTWHEIGVTAFWSEYNAKTNVWKQYSYQMLSKCAESLALRKSFPAQLSGLYAKEEISDEELDKATIQTISKNTQKEIDVKPLYIEKLSIKQVIDLQTILNGCDPEYKEKVNSFLPKRYSVQILDDVPETEYEILKSAFIKNKDIYQKKLAEQEMEIKAVNEEAME